MILAIDTSSAVTVLGTGADHRGVTARAEGGRKHAEEIDRLFAEHIAPTMKQSAPIQAVAVGIGPGPYSGLRVGISFGIGLARAWGVRIVGVCSLDVRAWQIAATVDDSSPREFTVTTDARRHEVYAARYLRSEHLVRTFGPTVEEETIAEPVYRDVEIDPAAMAVRVFEFLESGCTPQKVNADLVPHGRDAANYQLGPGPLFVPTPLYLRQPDITVSKSVTP